MPGTTIGLWPLVTGSIVLAYGAGYLIWTRRCCADCVVARNAAGDDAARCYDCEQDAIY